MSHHGTGDYVLSCPFCEFEDHDPDFLSQHVAFCHPEDRDPLHHAPHDQTTGEEDGSTAANLDDTSLYVSCPHGCGESVARAELQLHLDLHVAESVALDESDKFKGESLTYGQPTAQPDSFIDTHYESPDLHSEEEDTADQGHSRDIVLEGKTAGSKRRRHKKEGIKPGQRKLGVGVPSLSIPI